MLYRIAADAVLLLHFSFTLFVVLGGFLVIRFPALLRVHLAALFWGVAVEWADWLCPLTPLENVLRERGGEAGYAGGFVEHYLAPLLYPESLTIRLRFLLGLALVAINLLIYGAVFLTRLRSDRHKRP